MITKDEAAWFEKHSPYQYPEKNTDNSRENVYVLGLTSYYLKLMAVAYQGYWNKGHPTTNHSNMF